MRDSNGFGGGGRSISQPKLNVAAIATRLKPRRVMLASLPISWVRSTRLVLGKASQDDKSENRSGLPCRNAVGQGGVKRGSPSMSHDHSPAIALATGPS